MTLSALILRSTSTPSELEFWCIVGFIAGIVGFFKGFGLLQRRRLILDTPFSRIRSASMGMVEVSGLATGPYTLTAPITSRPCYYYRTIVWEWKQHGKNKKWVIVAGDCMHVPFFVDDNTGRVLVDPRGAELDMHLDFEDEFSDSFFSTLSEAPGNVSAFLTRHGVATNNKIKVQEYCIKPKNSLFILGTLAENPGLEVRPEPISDPGAIESMSGRFSLSISSVSFVTATGRSSEIMNPLFTRGASQGATRGVGYGTAATLAPQKEGGSFDLHPPVVLQKGTNNKTFLISWHSQREVARVLGWKSSLMIWGGAALALGALYIFLSLEQLL